MDDRAVNRGTLRFRVSGILKNLWVDFALLIGLLLEMNLHFTGLTLHEWLGIGMGAGIVLHLLLHWKWIIEVGRRLIRKLPLLQRIKYLLDILIFVDMVVIIATGIWISEVVMRQLGLTVQPGFFWRELHHESADWGVWLIGLHLALNWNRVVAALKRYLWSPLFGLRRSPTLSTGGAK